MEGPEDLRGLPPLVSETPARTLEQRTQSCPLLTGVTSAETSKAVFGTVLLSMLNRGRSL